MSEVEGLSKAILRLLLADFVDRTLGSSALSEGYNGVSLAVLKDRCSSDGTASPVDFDLALKDLEERGLIDTGPLVPFDNPPGAALVVIGLLSKYEYAYLTEKGYKAAQEARSTKSPKSARLSVHISGGHFHQSPIGIGDEVTQSVAFSGTHTFMDLRKVVNESGIEDSVRAKLLASIEAMERAHNTSGFVDQYRDFIALAANYMTIISPFLPALSAHLR
jgi:hypothetical protein